MRSVCQGKQQQQRLFPCVHKTLDFWGSSVELRQIATISDRQQGRYNRDMKLLNPFLPPRVELHPWILSSLIRYTCIFWNGNMAESRESVAKKELWGKAF